MQRSNSIRDPPIEPSTRVTPESNNNEEPLMKRPRVSESILPASRPSMSREISFDPKKEISDYAPPDLSVRAKCETPPTSSTQRELKFDADNTPDLCLRIEDTPECQGRPSTQPTPYSQDSLADEQSSDIIVLRDESNGKIIDLKNGKDYEGFQVKYTIGRSTIASLSIPDSNLFVGRNHAWLLINKLDGTMALQPEGNHSCYLLTEGKWKEYKSPKTVYLNSGDTFRLIPNPKTKGKHNLERVHFTIVRGIKQGSRRQVGPNSFDEQYLQLLGKIEHEGNVRSNKKGKNRTYREAYNMVIDLHSEDESILPLSSLRFLGRSALVEALWYLRGESDIKFLQENKCFFWDKQAKDGDWVGLNYALLVNFPGKTKSINQLEENVLKPLCDGQFSRNMMCSLKKPGEETVQQACTSSIQFSVVCNQNGDQFLDMTVNQRSSDVILGLPHDVAVWSIILHLVRREVKMRSHRLLKAGKLIFAIGSGGAHVYEMNKMAAKILRFREPKTYGIMPNLVVSSDKGMFEIAQTFKLRGDDICIQNYKKTHCHEPIQINQAV